MLIKTSVISSFLTIFIVLLLAPLTTHAEISTSKPKYTFQKKEPRFSLIYYPINSAAGEIKIYKGFSILAGFTILPPITFDHENHTESLSMKSLYMAFRYYLTGEPLHHGLFLEYSPYLSQINLGKERSISIVQGFFRREEMKVSTIERVLFIRNSLRIGYRWAITGSFFVELEGGVNHNLVYKKDPNGYGNIPPPKIAVGGQAYDLSHFLFPELALGFGYSF